MILQSSLMWLPDPDSLLCFLRAADSLHFRRAAGEVGLTPSAFGARLRQLEEQLGGPLFERTTRQVRLTARGHALIPAARVAVESLRVCAEGAPAASLPLSIGTRHELGMSWLLPEIDALEKSVAGLRLSVVFASSDEMIARTRMGTLDAFIASVRLHDQALDTVPLHEETYCLVAASSYLRSHPLSKPEQAATHVLLDAEPSLPLYRYFADAPLAPTMAFKELRYFGTIAALRARVLKGAGVAVLPEYLVRKDLNKGSLVRVMPRVKPLSDAFRLVFRRGDARETALRLIASHLRQTPLR